MVNEGIRMNAILLKYFYGFVLLGCLVLFIYSFAMLLDKKDPWSLSNNFTVVYAGLFFIGNHV